MSEQKESSVLFSLKELMNLEEDRIRGEEADKAARVAAEEESRRQAERAAREAEEARMRSEEERRRAEEQRSREEGARLEAIRVAEIEKARLEAEGQARMAAMASQQQHELQIQALQTDKGKKKLRNILIGVVAAVICIGSVLGYLAVDANKKAEAKQAQAQAEIKKKEEELAALQKKADEAANNVKNLELAVSNETDQRKKAELQAQLNAAKKDADAAAEAAGKPAVRGGPLPPKAGGDDAPKPKAACTCKSTDPLCDCL